MIQSGHHSPNQSLSCFTQNSVHWIMEFINLSTDVTLSTPRHRISFVITVSLYTSTKLKKKSNCFIYIVLAKYCWVFKLGEFKSDQTYFAKDIRKSWKPQQISQHFESSSANVPIAGEDFLRVFYKLLYLQLCDSWSVKKICVAKALLEIWEIFLHENNRNYHFYRFSYKFAFIPFLSFLTNQKQKSGFQQVGGLVKRNIFALLQIHAEFNRLL